MKITNIKDPSFLKNMKINELIELSKDMNKFILETVSKTGGHLSGNLGVIDLTIALLKVFDAKKDIIIYDVGHQSYAYKILTGRANDFINLRKKGGLSGFQSINESPYDKYEAGHSSTSLSAGAGFAFARDLNKKDYNVISIIGDGSLANGLAYEALNNIGSSDAKQIIIINDNEMSISKNVGAIHNLLDQICSGKTYLGAKEGTKSFLKHIPLGKYLYNFLENIKYNLKKLYVRRGSMFTDLGFEYYGPINGHDFNELIKYFNIAKKGKKSVILHVITQKGIGYKPAEEDKEGKFHGIGAFDIETGELLNKNNLPSYSEVISSFVLNYAKKDKDIICITPGMSYGSKLDIIKEKLPKQYIDVGINEEHSLILANSLALSGKKPILFIYSTFLQRGYDELVHDVAKMNQNVTILVDRSGFVPGDGPSHQGVFDIAFSLSIPNLIVTMPKDSKEANNLIYTSISTNNPFVIRYPKNNIKYDYSKGEMLKIGSWEVIRKGEDGTIISYGDFTNRAYIIADYLSTLGIHLNVVNARFLKPIDSNLFNELLKKNKPIFVYEESMKIGSLGSYLSMLSQETDYTSKIITFGIEDNFPKIGTREELIKENNLDENTIIKKIKEYYGKSFK